MTIPTFNIKNVADVEKFFMWLKDNDILLHPDDGFTWLVDFAEEEGEIPCITREQGTYLDDVMDKCFEVCEDSNADIYELSPFNV